MEVFDFVLNGNDDAQHIFVVVPKHYEETYHCTQEY